MYGDRLWLWNDRGDPRGSTPLPANAMVIGMFDWLGEPLVLTGGPTVRALALDGTERAAVPFGDFSANDAATVRLPDGTTALAVAGTAARDVGRWRLLLLSATRETLYEEIFDRPIRLLTAKTAGGPDVLLVGGGTLRMLRPRSSSAQR